MDLLAGHSCYGLLGPLGPGGTGTDESPCQQFRAGTAPGSPCEHERLNRPDRAGALHAKLCAFYWTERLVAPARRALLISLAHDAQCRSHRLVGNAPRTISHPES